MHVIPDVDVLALLATSLAAKRRPAEPIEIVAAIDLIHGNIPNEDKLSEAFARLGASGLLVASGNGVSLTEAAEALIERLPRKGEHDLRLFELRGLLGAYRAPQEAAPLTIDAAQWRAAMLAHRATAAAGGKNLLVPKPKPVSDKARPGQRQRKPLAKARKR